MSKQVDLKALISHIVKGDGENRCRICMGDTTEGQVFLGDTVMMEGTRPVSLSELLENITGIEMSEESLFPKGVCVSCVMSVLSAYELNTLVVKSHKLWRDTVNALEQIPTKNMTSVKSVCAILNGDPIDITIVNNYSDINHVTSLNKPKKKHKVKRTRPRNRSDKKGYKCPDCNKEFSSILYLQAHLQNSAQKEACMSCGVVLTRGKEIHEHTELVHRETVHACPDCPSWYTEKDKLKEHKILAHRQGVYTCGDCGRHFTRKGSFETHLQLHAVRTCRNCNAQFANRSCYRVHRAICEPDARPVSKSLSRRKRCNNRDPTIYTCDYCGKAYTSRPQLKNHIIWIHLDIRPFQCQVCGKKFHTSARLTEHSIVHTGERNFHCELCGYKLVTKMALVYHMRRHTGEKPYKCEDCNETFISASRRSEHAKRKHGKGKMFQCMHCSQPFVRSHELRKHIDKAHQHVIKTEIQEWSVIPRIDEA